jgi:hypothetical protein
MIDVLRAAVAEVADYPRVRVISKSRVALAGRGVADVIHVIAELVENATIFSPPNTPVRMLGDAVGRGYAVEIEDRGLGMTSEKLAELNVSLADPPDLNLEDSEQLGLYVAARLAKLHGIRITLRDSPFGGTTAIVLIPQDLVVPEGKHAADPAAIVADERAIQLTGRHAARSMEEDASRPGFLAGDHDAVSGDGPDHGNGHSGPGAPPGRNGAPVWFAQDADAAAQNAGKGRPDAADPETAAGDPADPGLPQRTPQASLAPQLRDSGGHDLADAYGGSSGPRSPDEVRDALTAIQQGWERGRKEFTAPGPPGAETAADGAPRDSRPAGSAQRPGQEDSGDASSPDQGGMRPES